VTDHITCTRAGGTLELRLNRPDKKNALTSAMYRALVEGLIHAETAPTVSNILISAEGTCFCAGNDLNDFLETDGAAAAFSFIRTIAQFGKPVVTAVQGLAVGIGTTMLLHCDFIYASPESRFSTPFIRLGLVPEAASSLLLPARVGRPTAAAMLMAGESIDGPTAERLGLITGVVPLSDLYSHAVEKAAILAAMPTGALFNTRQLMRPDMAEVLARIDEEEIRFLAAMRSTEARDALDTFLNRRKGTR
jgi:enoyl-CoA hydratase/carnithine racemase